MFAIEFLLPVLLFAVVCITVMITSYFAQRSNRKAFINKKLVQVLAKQREESLMTQKEEQEALIHSIFPRAIASDLISKHSVKTFGTAGGSLLSSSLGASADMLNVNSTLACMHQVSIHGLSLSLIFSSLD